MYFSPYSGTDSNCGNPLVLSLDELVKDGLLEPHELPQRSPVEPCDFQQVAAVKWPLLKRAAAKLLDNGNFKALREQLSGWRKAHAWVEDSALFEVARVQPELSQMAWWDWPEPLRFRQPEAIAAFREEHKQAIEEYVAIQFLFDKQWKAVREYANSKGIQIIGDMPIYVGGHSADVWANQELFELGPSGKAANVSGVPPDAFSDVGQLWGSPLYKWPAHKAQNYEWWAQRLGRSMELYDETRIDHFRGFAGYWSVDGAAETAMIGAWKKGPGLELFAALKEKLGSVPILAEDLGVITTDVVQLRESINAPGMVVLQFAWGGGTNNVHLPHMHYENSFCYTGTHDNETSAGWFQSSANERDKSYLKAYLGSDGKDIAWDFIRASMTSVSRTCVFPMQDVMRLDNSARMNAPGTVGGNNWKWRIGEEDVWANLKKEAAELRQLVITFDRLPRHGGNSR